MITEWQAGTLEGVMVSSYSVVHVEVVLISQRAGTEKCHMALAKRWLWVVDWWLALRREVAILPTVVTLIRGLTSIRPICLILVARSPIDGPPLAEGHGIVSVDNTNAVASSTLLVEQDMPPEGGKRFQAETEVLARAPGSVREVWVLRDGSDGILMSSFGLYLERDAPCTGHPRRYCLHCLVGVECSIVSLRKKVAMHDL